MRSAGPPTGSWRTSRLSRGYGHRGAGLVYRPVASVGAGPGRLVRLPGSRHRDTGAAEDLIGAARAAFSDWTALLADKLQAAGVPEYRTQADTHRHLGHDRRRAHRVPRQAQQPASHWRPPLKN